MADRMTRTSAEVLGVLVLQRGRALLGYSYLLTLDLPEAEDLLQDALVKVFASSRKVAPAALEAYVRRAILTLYIDRSRRRRRFEAITALVGRERGHQRGPEEFVPTRVDVLTAVRDLPPRQRACMVLRFFDDLQVHEIADRVGIGEGTVKRYLSLATQRMAGSFSFNGDDPPSVDDTAVVLKGR